MVLLTMKFSPEKLKRKILRDKYNSLVFEKGRGRELYLVGGFVRDILRGIRSKDRDYIVSGDIRSFAKEIRKITGGTIVELRKEHMIRIALKNGTTLDFSKPMGTLEEDLSKRDFTINAIAWSPSSGIIDPYHGIEDIQKRRIHLLAKENLIADPLRMLRAYRFAAELNGYIEKRTRNSLKMFNNMINETSSERITLELFNLLNLKHSAKYLQMALSDDLLTDIISINYSQLDRNIKDIFKLEQINKKFSLKIQVLLKKIFSQILIYKGLLCLEILLNKKDSLTPQAISKIKMSNKIIKRIELAYKGIRKSKEKEPDKLFDLFLVSKEAAMDVLIITGKCDLLKDYDRFRRIWKRGLLSSEEIIKVTEVKTGPRIGIMINEIKRAQFEGRIKTKKDAIRLLISII
ncbi:MAG: CCA tRNA nucleotidyltransferase [Nitrospira sp.]|nr:CCA tRNA nucleotidyltransferase [Nitrospira sp.]